MKTKESWSVNVCPALGHLTVLFFFFWVIRFVWLTLILGKITGEKNAEALLYRSVKREWINVKRF